MTWMVRTWRILKNKNWELEELHKIEKNSGPDHQRYYSTVIDIRTRNPNPNKTLLYPT